MLFGLLFFAERLRPWQWLAVGARRGSRSRVLTVDYGRLPWIALTLAVSFGSYGLIKKRLGLPPPRGCSWSRPRWRCPALGYLVWLTVRGDATFTEVSAGHTVLLR